MRVYVAGSSKEREERAKPMIKRLRQLGFKITHDWTIDMDVNSSGIDNNDANVAEGIRRDCSILDANGVRTADYVILLAPNDRGSTGAWVELGLAIAYGVPILVCGANNKRTIFTSLGVKLFDTDQEGFNYLMDLVKQQELATLAQEQNQED